MHVPSNQPAKIVGIFPSSSATPFMQKEFDSVDVLEKRGALRTFPLGGGRIFAYPFHLPRLVEPRKLGNLLLIYSRLRKSQFLLKSLLQHADIPVLTKHQWHDQPMIPRTHLAVVPVISVKCSLLPARNVRTFPFVIFRFLVKRRGFVMDVPGRQNLSGLYCKHGLAHLHAIHIDRAALWDSFERKLMFCGNGAHQSNGAPRACNSFTRRQIRQCDRHVISGMKLQNLFARQFRTPLHSLNYSSLRFPTARSVPHCPSSNAALPPGSPWKCRRAWSLPAPRVPPRIPPPTVRLCRRGS